MVSSLIPIAFTNCSFKMNGINKIFKVLEHFVLIQAALGACIEQESQLIKKIVKRKEFFFCVQLLEPQHDELNLDRFLLLSALKAAASGIFFY